MAAFSCQTLFLSNEYTAHVKDRSTLAAEVLHEYDEKVRYCLQFVLPRAMPLVRDASTMTDEVPQLPPGYF